METIKKFFQSFSLRGALIVGGATAAALAIFVVGETVGYKKASFSYRWGSFYERNFIGPRDGRPRVTRELGRKFMNPHGAFGTVVAVDASSMLVAGDGAAEKMVRIGDGTALRKFRDAVGSADIRVGDSVVVVGAPDGDGVLDARLIRVLPSGNAAAGGKQKSWRGR